MYDKTNFRVSAMVSGVVATLLILMLTSCSPATDPRAIADGEATVIQAESEAADAAQEREFARENQDWERVKREERAEFWAAVEPTAKKAGRAMAVALGIGGFIWAVFTGVSLGLAAFYTATAYRDFVTIRARLVYPDARGNRPLLLWQEAVQKNGLLARHIHGGRWFLTDTVSGAGRVVDATRQPTAVELEILRQSLLLGQTSSSQVASGKTSPHGQIAEAIGGSGFVLPDAGQVIIDDAKMEVQG